MGVLSKFVTVNPKALGAGVALCAGVLFYVTNRRANGHSTQPYHIAQKLPGDAGGKRERAAVDLTFFRRLFKLLRIIIPSLFSPEVGYLVLVAVNLVLRTWLDIWMIQNGTAIEGSIISRNNTLFLENLFRFIYAMPMIGIVNSLIKYGLSELKLRFRTRMSTHLCNRYMRGFTFYTMSNVDNRIRNPDQLLTQDVEKFCDALAELYSNISKPVLDIILYAYRLTTAIGAQGPLTMLAYLVASGLILTRLRAPAGSMTMKEQHLEGEYRYVYSRVITNSEEISFYQGSRRERFTIQRMFSELVHHLRRFIMFQFSMGFIDNIIAKYVATVVGYMVVSRPFLTPAHAALLGTSHSERTLYYYRSGRMLVRMAQAMGRLVLAGREMTKLAGYVARMTEFIKVLKDIEEGTVQPTPVSTSGEYVEADRIIRFENVPLMTPNGDVLVKELNFEVTSGMNVLVCGPNGCGKSSLFRILGELWPLYGGRVVKPKAGKLFYVPQRPYMTLGTLRDQVIYPDSKEGQQEKGISDGQLAELLEKVQLSYLLEREGWEAVKDWMDVMSGGEKQRMAMARLFYHEPQFAILDECTSNVSVDVESYIYRHCREKGITLFTVSHRKSLWTHHEYVLQFDGRGKYEYKPIDSSTEEFGS